jgi:hypothetical protein
MKTSQKESIKRRLLIGLSITPIDALNLYNCFRLGARINDLRREGMFIDTTMVKNMGKRYASYSLKKKIDWSVRNDEKNRSNT